MDDTNDIDSLQRLNKTAPTVSSSLSTQNSSHAAKAPTARRRSEITSSSNRVSTRVQGSVAHNKRTTTPDQAITNGAEATAHESTVSRHVRSEVTDTRRRNRNPGAGFSRRIALPVRRENPSSTTRETTALKVAAISPASTAASIDGGSARSEKTDITEQQQLPKGSGADQALNQLESCDNNFQKNVSKRKDHTQPQKEQLHPRKQDLQKEQSNQRQLSEITPTQNSKQNLLLENRQEKKRQQDHSQDKTKSQGLNCSHKEKVKNSDVGSITSGVYRHDTIQEPPQKHMLDRSVIESQNTESPSQEGKKQYRFTENRQEQTRSSRAKQPRVEPPQHEKSNCKAKKNVKLDQSPEISADRVTRNTQMTPTKTTQAQARKFDSKHFLSPKNSNIKGLHHVDTVVSKPDGSSMNKQLTDGGEPHGSLNYCKETPLSSNVDSTQKVRKNQSSTKQEDLVFSMNSTAHIMEAPEEETSRLSSSRRRWSKPKDITSAGL